MDKEKIIIDGVDVSGCDFLAKEDIYNSYSGVTTAYKGQCGCSDDEMCKDRRNCGYKKLAIQLQRKTAECEELKAYAQAQENQRETYYKEFLKLSQECEELKEYIEANKATGICETCTHKALLENDRYRKAFEPFQDEYFKGLDTKQIAELAKKSIRLTTENRKLENKLSDIAGICEQILDGEDYVRRISKTILDIID